MQLVKWCNNYRQSLVLQPETLHSAGLRIRLVSIGKLDVQAKKFEGEAGLRLLDSPHLTVSCLQWLNPAQWWLESPPPGLKTPQRDDINKLFNSGQLYVTWRSAVMWCDPMRRIERIWKWEVSRRITKSILWLFSVHWWPKSWMIEQSRPSFLSHYLSRGVL